jgi:hypothetical protein
MSGGRPALAVAALAASVAIALMPPPQASARGVARDVVSVLTPGSDGLAARSRATVRIRLAPGARLRRVTLDGRNVTGRFRRMGSRLFKAHLMGLTRGSNHLWVSARIRRGQDGYAVRRFYAGSRPSPRFLSVAGVSRRVGARPLRVRVRARSRPVRTVVRLNGRRVEHAFVRRARARLAPVVSASHGLRFGRNRLKVVAWHRNGTYDVERRSFVVHRTRPLAAAGIDRMGRARSPLRLDGTRSRPRRAGTPLAFSWRIVAKPRGSRARLLRPSSVRPVLRPDRPGRYRLRLTVSERQRRGQASAAAVVGASDSVTATVQPAWDPARTGTWTSRARPCRAARRQEPSAGW